MQSNDVGEFLHGTPTVEAQILTLCAETGFFAQDFYSVHYPDVSTSGIAPLHHYLMYGGKEGRYPSPYFDSEWYLKEYPNVIKMDCCPLVHYLTEGRRLGYHPIANSICRSPNAANRLQQYKEGQAPIDYNFELIYSSGVFDAEFYVSNYSDVKASGQDALIHYCNLGWQEGRRPNKNFNGEYYVKKYPDVAQSKMNPLVHWILFGKGENRLTDIVEVVEDRRLRTNAPQVIFLAHEASQTGAPAVLLSLIEWFKKNHSKNFSIIIGHSGPLNERFRALGPCFCMDEPHADFRNELYEFCGHSVRLIYGNTIASGRYLKHLSFLNAEIVTHVHEMENVFRVFENDFAYISHVCNRYIVVSEGCEEALLRRRDPKSTEILRLPPFISPASDVDISEDHRFVGKKIVFGCGTVEHRKGFDIFCDVAEILRGRNLDGFAFVWIGRESAEGPSPFEEISKRQLYDTVYYLGARDNPRAWFRTGSVFLLPSREDPFPLACLEAAECGLPVVCFDGRAGGMEKFVRGDAGFVVDYLNTAEMADRVYGLLSDEAVRLSAGKVASSRVRSEFYVANAAAAILKFLPATTLEPVKLPRNEFEAYANEIVASAVISFDIFDTLVVRMFRRPESVFDSLEHDLSLGSTVPVSFFEERMRTAGEALAAFRGRYEDITIQEIYSQMSLYRDPAPELALESRIMMPHPLGRKLYDFALSQGKPIFLVSDMYLDEVTVRKILSDCGYGGFAKLFLSSTHRLKKESGKLFEVVNESASHLGFRSQQILHIGDNWLGDVERPKQAGLRSLRFQPLNERRRTLFPAPSSAGAALSREGRIWESLSAQMASLWYEADPPECSDFFVRLGYEVTGPFALSLAVHSYRVALKSEAQKILFLARDGRIAKIAYDALQAYGSTDTISSEYAWLSRATVVPATLRNPLSDSDVYFLMEGIHLAQKPVRYYLKKANLDLESPAVVREVLRNFDSIDDVPGWSDRKRLARTLTALSEVIYSANEQNRTALEAYLKSLGLDEIDTVVVVDVGWLLNIQTRLQQFLNSLGWKTRLVGAYMGSRARAAANTDHHSLLFELGEPSIFSDLVERHVSLFEVLFSAPEIAATGLHVNDFGEVDVLFKERTGKPDAEFIAAQQIQFGAVQFIQTLDARHFSALPSKPSADYVFHAFASLANSRDPLVLSKLANFHIKLGGQHDLSAVENLVSYQDHREYRVAPRREYFPPLVLRRQFARDSVVIVTSAGLDNGSTRYRAANLQRAVLSAGGSAILIHSQTPMDYAVDLIRNAGSIVFQRCFASQGNVGRFLDCARRFGKKSLFEVDDFVFSDFVDQIGSVKGGEWDREEAMWVAKAYEEMLKQLDGCIASTELIGRYIRAKFGTDVLVFPNMMERSTFRQKTYNEDAALSLVYASGTYSHASDFLSVEHAIYEFIREYKNVRLTVLGSAQVSGRILGLPNVQSTPLLSYPGMLDVFCAHDVLLVPLENDRFNRAKSNIKFLEAASQSVPVLASPVGEFKRTFRDGEAGLFAADAVAWYDKLVWMASHRRELSGLGLTAARFVRRHFCVDELEDSDRSRLTAFLG
ncbi:glycosyltransferase [Methylobacterium sp. E-065]|uniref:glycosyltransferase n=1 Tax=Methylobacterium sp. E-065 TaxID=2836583 RepID=UPI001FBB5498|nr:glycosyltransferase [Methylobacterium sp. E-065]MCJ2016302.1 glycosyltransferase [Methylobacterium sp. E-065]